MSNQEVRFFPADFSIVFQGAKIALRGLLSELGVTRVTAISTLPPDWKDAYGKTYIVSLDKLEVRGVLVQHFDSGGACSLIRFVSIDEEQRLQIQRMIESGGVHPSWQRKLPRISVEASDSDLPLPSLCTVRFAGQEVYVEVLNFTLGGLGVKSIGSQLSEARVGMQIQLDLITSKGDLISNFAAQIMNISVYDWAGKDEAASNLRYLGLKIIDMSIEGKQIYKNLIRDYCLAVQAKPR